MSDYHGPRLCEGGLLVLATIETHEGERNDSAKHCAKTALLESLGASQRAARLNLVAYA